MQRSNENTRLPGQFRALRPDGTRFIFARHADVEVLVEWDVPWHLLSDTERHELHEGRPSDFYSVLEDHKSKEFWLVSTSWKFSEARNDFLPVYQAQLLSFEELAYVQAIFSPRTLEWPPKTLGLLKYIGWVKTNLESVRISAEDEIAYRALTLAARGRETLPGCPDRIPLGQPAEGWIDTLAGALKRRLDEERDAKTSSDCRRILQRFLTARRNFHELGARLFEKAEERIRTKTGQTGLIIPINYYYRGKPRKELRIYNETIEALKSFAESLSLKYSERSRAEIPQEEAKADSLAGNIPLARATEFDESDELNDANLSGQLEPKEAYAILLLCARDEIRESSRQWVEQLFPGSDFTDMSVEKDELLASLQNRKELLSFLETADRRAALCQAVLGITVVPAEVDGKARSATWENAGYLADKLTGAKPRIDGRDAKDILERLKLNCPKRSGGRPKSNSVIQRWIKSYGPV